MARSDEAEKPSNLLQDTVLRPFLQTDFDPATFLNSALPPLSTGFDARSTFGDSTSLAEITTHAQSLLSKLSLQATRLSNNLTQLTDEIVRSGGRLAYEVELLRGEAIGLSDALSDGLKEEFEIFVPTGSPASNDEGEKVTGLDTMAATRYKPGQPEYLTKLHTLTAVRDRLDEVIKLFDEAMKWPIAPIASTGIASSLISVSAPISTEESEKLGAQAKEHVDDLRKELNGMLRQGADGGSLALKKMQRLRAVAEIFKGTAEEKARSQIIDDLQKLVNEQYKDDNTSTAPRSGMDYRYGGTESKLSNGNGYGFLSNLRNLKNEVYPE